MASACEINNLQGRRRESFGISGLAERGLVVIEKDTLLIPDVEALELEAER